MTGKILIFEGVDLAGKDTAIEKFVKTNKDGFVLRNAYKPSMSKDYKIFDAYFSMLGACCELDSGYVILNRCYPSEAVYSILRGEDRMDSGMIKAVESAFIDRGDAFLIMLDTPAETLIERYHIRGDEHVDLEQILMLRERYETFFEQSKLPKMKIDTTDPTWVKQVETFACITE